MLITGLGPQQEGRADGASRVIPKCLVISCWQAIPLPPSESIPVVRVTLPFGRYRGWRLADIPDEYLSRLLDWDLKDPLRSAVYHEVDVRFGGAPREPEQPAAASRLALRPDQVALAQRVWDAGYRALALRAHSDAGGSPAEMRRVWDAGYRTLALRAHPDVGGDAAEMRELNALAAEFVIAKQRCGPTGMRKMKFLNGIQKFECYASEAEVGA
jgi:hypothetical protein